MTIMWTAAHSPLDVLYDELVPQALQTLIDALDLADTDDTITQNHLFGFKLVTRKAFAKAAPDLRDLNDAAAAWAEQSAARLVQGINKETKKALARTIAHGLKQGWSDDEFAKAVSKKVGLGDRYVAAVETYRLQQINKGKSAGDARRLANAYANQLRQQRALAIAKTEVQAALINAQRELWVEGVADGDLPSYAHRKWMVHKDEYLCPQCRPLHGKVVPLEKGTYKGGGITVIGPPLHPNCRCFEELVNARGRVIKHDKVPVVQSEYWEPKFPELLEKARARGPAKVRTRGGEKKYGQRRGTIIVRDIIPATRAKRSRSTPASRAAEAAELKQREADINAERNVNIRRVEREDDKRIIQGQTPTYLFHPGTKEDDPKKRVPGRQETALTKTEAGDTTEVLFGKKGVGIVMRFLGVTGHGQAAGVEGQRNIPIDHVIGGEGGSQRFAAEIKSQSDLAPDPKVSIRFESKTLKLWAIEDDAKAHPRKKRMIPLIVAQKVHQNKDGSGSVDVYVYEGAYDSMHFDVNPKQRGERERAHMVKIGSYKFSAKEWDAAMTQGKVNAAAQKNKGPSAESRHKVALAKLKKQLMEAKRRVRKDDVVIEGIPVEYDADGDPIFELDTVIDFSTEPPEVYVAGEETSA